MKKLDESEIIKIFQNKFSNRDFVSEDVEMFNLGKNKIAVKIDTMVESTDIPPKMKLGDAARKSIVACVSDFASKGLKPEYGIISVNIPKSISRIKIHEIAKGFKNACNEFDISIIGGDTNSGKEIVFNVCIFGKGEKIPSRRGSRNNDLVFVTGPFGYTSAGLRILLGNKRGDKKLMNKAINSVLKPKPRLVFGLQNKKYFSSSMDSSDGLSTTLNEMAKQSKKRFVINNIPVRKDLEKYARSQKLNLKKLVFHGGEEYEFIFTISPKYKQLVKRNARLVNTPIIEIGYVTTGKGVFVKDEEKYKKLKDLGWDHFR